MVLHEIVLVLLSSTQFWLRLRPQQPPPAQSATVELRGKGEGVCVGGRGVNRWRY